MKIFQKLQSTLAKKLNPALTKELAVLVKENHELREQNEFLQKRLEKDEFLQKLQREELEIASERLTRVSRELVETRMQSLGIKPTSSSKLSRSTSRQRN